MIWVECKQNLIHIYFEMTPLIWKTGQRSPCLETARRLVRVCLFFTILLKFLIITHFILAFFGKNVLLTAKIKNTILVALESAESLYQSSNFMRSTQNLKKSSLWSEHLLSKCTKHEENCSNFFLRNLNVISLVFILFFDKNMKNFN